MHNTIGIYAYFISWNVKHVGYFHSSYECMHIYVCGIIDIIILTYADNILLFTMSTSTHVADETIAFLFANMNNVHTFYFTLGEQSSIKIINVCE